MPLHLRGGRWVITGHSSKFHSIRDCELYSENTVSLKSVTCWQFPGFPVSWGGTSSCSHTALIVCVFRHFLFVLTFSPSCHLLTWSSITVGHCRMAPASLSIPLTHGTGPVWQSCPVQLCAASTQQVCVPCSGSHPLSAWEVCVLLLKSTWGPRADEAQPLGCLGKKVCAFNGAVVSLTPDGSRYPQPAAILA